MNAPTPRPPRILFLDVLRGVAMLGILAVNIPYFALPGALAEEGVDVLHGPEAYSVHVVDGFFSFRFISIFSFLFGVGIAILKQRCDARGASHTIVMLRRLGALLLFGGLHILLLWYGDILLLYGLLGLACFACVRWRATILAAVGATLLLPPVILTAALAAWPWPDAPEPYDRPDISAEAVERMSAVADGSLYEFLPALDDMDPAFETAVYRNGTLLRQLLVRVATWLDDLSLYAVIVAPRVLGLMVLGMACARSGWILRPDEARTAFRRCAAWGLIAGIPLQALGSITMTHGDGRSQCIGYTLLQIASLLMAAGYVGVVGLITGRANGPPAWTRPLAALGRTAFSNYILQSLVCTAIFYSWGLGLFGRFDRVGLWGVVGGVWALQLAASTWYVRRFETGPLEFFWRRLTYGQSRPADTHAGPVA